MNHPEPFASLVDILTAAQKLEEASHAIDASTTLRHLTATNNYLQYAYDYLNSTPYKRETEQIKKAQLKLASLQSGVPTDSHALNVYQHGPLYKFQGELSFLSKELWKLWIKSCVTNNPVYYPPKHKHKH